jgi:hypothetical protein
VGVFIPLPFSSYLCAHTILTRINTANKQNGSISLITSLQEHDKKKVAAAVEKLNVQTQTAPEQKVSKSTDRKIVERCRRNLERRRSWVRWVRSLIGMRRMLLSIMRIGG